jgi:hypothetical protein
MSIRILDAGTIDLDTGKYRGPVVGYTTKDMDGNPGEEIAYGFSRRFRSGFKTTNEFLQAAWIYIEETLAQ